MEKQVKTVFITGVSGSGKTWAADFLE